MKRRRILSIIVVSVVVLAVAAAGVLYSQGHFGSNQANSTTSYTVDQLTTGNIEKSVTGTGTLAAGGEASETVPVDLKIDGMKVAVGQNVKAGDTIATIDAASIADTITALQSDISTIDSSLAKQASSEASVGYLKSQVSGRVEKIYCAVGSDAEQKTLENGGLFLLSTDGKLKVDITLGTASATKTGNKVKVKTGGYTYTGLVESVSDDKTVCTVTLTDYTTKLGASAVVYTASGKKLGSGTLEINRPYLVPADAGKVSKVYVSVGQKISNRTSLAYLTGIPVSDTYGALTESRAEKVALLKTATELRDAGCIKAAHDGTVKALNAADGQEVKADDTIATVLTLDSMQLDVSIDELDINSVSVGQQAAIAVDAVSDKTFDGTVQSMSQIGTTSNGVTTYGVTISLPADASAKVGMNATATIVIEKHAGVLLMPIEALNTMQGKAYVWLYTGTLPTDSSQQPGTRKEVTTGLSNDNYVEITGGLTSGDQVVVVRTKSTTGSSNGNQSSFFGMGGMGGDMPSGGMPGGGPGGFPGGGPGGNR